MKKNLIVLCAGWIIYLLVKIFSPYFVAHLFDSQAFELLNRLTISKANNVLEFYQGRMQETVWGPFLQTLSFILLAFMLKCYFLGVSAKRFALIIFLFLILTKYEILFNPPYGDAIGGPFAEALWLSQNSFDYAGLLKQPNFVVGGPRVYFFSIYPGFLALTLKAIPWTPVFLLFHHLLTFALTAGIIAMFRECARKVFEPTLAILAALILLAMPLYQSQSEAINMEIPVTFFAMASAFFLVEKRWFAGAIFASLAAATKGIGVVACGGVAMVLFIMAIRTLEFKEKMKFLGLTFVAGATAIFIGVAKFFFKDTHVEQGLVGWEAGWPSLKNEFIFYLFLISLIVFLFFLLFRVFRKKSLSQIYIPSVMILFALSWFVLFLNFYAVSPRYRVTLYPFLVFSCVYSVMLLVRNKLLCNLCASVVLAIACIYSYGLYYGSIEDNDHVMLERSLEYRNDLSVNRQLVAIAQKRYSEQLIVAPFTIAQALAIPELGYVNKSKKLNVMIYGFGLKYGGIENYKGLKQIDQRKTVFVGVKVAPIDPGFEYPLGPRDVVLEEIIVGNKKASFFIGGFAIEALWRFCKGIQLEQKIR